MIKMNSDLYLGVKEIILKAKYYFLISLVFSIFVSIKAGPFVGFLTNLVLNSFSAIIGSNEVLIEMITRTTKSSKRINEIHFHQLINDTDRLREIYNAINNESKEPLSSLGSIKQMIDDNLHTINAIKAAMNGVGR
jgi:hypothetical protein